MLGKIARLNLRLRAGFRRFKNCQRGAIPAFMGFTIIGMVGFAGMGIDGANWYAQKRISQNVADSAAVAATHAALASGGGDEQTMEDFALAAAQQNGFQLGAGSVLVVNAIAPSGSSGVVPRVEVIVQRDVPAYFAGILIDFQPKVASRAVGGILYAGKNCVIGLDPDDDNTVHFIGNNNTTVTCGVASNSESDESLVIEGSATLDTASVQAAGNIVVSGNGELIADDELVTSNHPPAPDPFDGVVFPDPPASCDIPGSFTVQPNTQISLAPSSPGGAFKFCGDVAIRGDLNLAPGTYYFHESDLTVNSQAALTCTGCTGGAGVTLVFSGTDGNNIGDIHINGGAEVALRAPDSGPYRGIVVYKQPSNDQAGSNVFNGGAAMALDGAVYIPAEEVQYSGGSDVDSCTVLIGRKISFTGSSSTYVNADETVCAEVGLGDITSENQQRLVVLVE